MTDSISILQVFARLSLVIVVAEMERAADWTLEAKGAGSELCGVLCWRDNWKWG